MANEQPPDIFKLKFDEFEPILSCLPLKNVLNFGKTCKYFLKIAGEYFQHTYLSSEVVCAKGRIYIRNTDVTQFAEYIRNMTIWFDTSEVCRSIENSCLSSLSQINFNYASLEVAVNIKDVLQRAQRLKLHHCNIKTDFFDDFFQFCTRVEYLLIENHLTDTSTIIGPSNNWMYRQYPQLKALGLDLTNNSRRIEEIVILIELNPGIEKFFISSGLLCANKDAFLKSGIQLDILTVKIHSATGKSDNIQNLFDCLKALHIKNFYQQLILIFEHFVIDGTIVEHMAALKGLTGLEINDASNIVDKIGLTQKLTDLKRVIINFAFSEDILPFLRFASEVSRLTVGSLGSGIHFADGVVDLMALSNHRKTNGEARKMTFFIEEDIFPATKAANRPIDSPLVQLKRIESQTEK